MGSTSSGSSTQEAVGCWWWVLVPGRVFSLCLGELIRCSARHRRYALISFGLTAYLVTRPRTGWKALVGFCYLQRVDDILDGHLESDREPENVALEQIDRWESGKFGESTLDRLGGALHRALPQSEKIVAIIREMIIDRRRVRERELLCLEELQAHLERTFGLSLDLMLLAAGAELTSDDAPSIKPLLGWCSVVRDLNEDLELGLINVPEEVAATREVRKWFEQEHERARKLFQETNVELEGLSERSGVGLLRLFHRSVGKYLRSFDAATAADRVIRKLDRLDDARPRSLNCRS